MVKKAGYLIPLFLLLTSLCGMSQNGQNIAFLRSIPQSNSLNPAINAPFRFWIGMPGISSLQMGFENSGFRYKDAIYRSSDDSLHFDQDGLLSALGKRNHIRFTLDEEVIAFGFKVRKAYVAFSLAERVSASFLYSKDIMALLLGGNAQFAGKTADFGNTGIDINAYHEAAIAISHPINDRLLAGIRLKYLSGIANVHFRRSDISLYTEGQGNYAMTLRSDIRIDATLPGMSAKPEDSLDFTPDADQLLKDITSLNNAGYGMDLGFRYTVNDRLHLGTGINNIGQIRWNRGVRNFISNNPGAEFTFPGIDISEFLLNDSARVADKIDDLLDTLTATFDLVTRYEPYTTRLNPRLFLSGQYDLLRGTHLGALFCADIYRERMIPSLTLHANHEFGKIFTLMGGYTLLPDDFFNLALGFSLKLGPVQLYLLSDNAYAFIDPAAVKYAQFHFGLNLVFGDQRTFRKVEAPKETNP